MSVIGTYLAILPVSAWVMATTFHNNYWLDIVLGFLLLFFVGMDVAEQVL